MYKLIIVDDEEIIRDGLKQLILDVYPDSYDIMEAGSGEEALALYDELKPDIIITDIQMSEMNGLQLIDRIRKDKANKVALIIISAYDDFEYAQKAIGYRVIKYILKPVHKKDMESALGEADAYLSSAKEMQRLSKQDADYRSLQETSLLQDAIYYGNMSFQELACKLRSAEHELTDPYYYMILVDVDARINPDISDIELIRKQLLDKLTGIIVSSKLAVTHDIEHHILLMINTATPSVADALVCTVEDTVHRIVDSYNTHRYLVVIGSVLPAHEQVKQAYDELILTSKYRIIEPNKKLIHADDYLNREDSHSIPADLFDYLNKAVISDNKRDIGRCLQDIFLNDEVRSSSIRHLKHLYDYLLDNIFTSLVKQYPHLEMSQSINELSLREFEEFSSIYEIITVLKRSLFNISSTITGQHYNDSDKDLIRKALQYIRSHYQDKNISMTIASNEISLSYSYFSRLFKHELGENFVSYLTCLRISEAKRLLKSTTYNIREIADKVGYGSPRYFTKLFQKTTGYLPGEYRKRTFV